MLTTEHIPEIRRTMSALSAAQGQAPPCLTDAQILSFCGLPVQLDSQLTEQLEVSRRAQILVADAALRDIMLHMLSVEASKLKREVEKPSRFIARLEEFYADHSQTLERNLLPHVTAWLAAHDDKRDPAEVTRAIVQQHIAESQRQIVALLGCEKGELAAKVGECVERWQEERSVVL